MTKTHQAIWVVVTITIAWILKSITGVGSDLYKTTVIWLLVINVSLVLYVGMYIESKFKK